MIEKVMTTAQSGVLAYPSTHALFLSFKRRLGQGGDAKLRLILSQIPEQTSVLSYQYPEAQLATVIAIGVDCWGDVFGSHRPQLLRHFPRISAALHAAPATDEDLLLHIRGERYDLLFELADQWSQALLPWFELVESISGFRYREQRDLTGFVDGTENPQTALEREQVALVSVGQDQQWAGGSYVHIQRYVHRLEHWRQLPVKQQEAIIGRTKDTDEELPDDVRPLTAHISRVVIEEDGEELALLRHSMPYGAPGGERGLLFAAYCYTPLNFEKMLARMVAPTDDGRVDHLLQYSTAVNGAAFFAPSVEALARLCQ